MIKKSDNNANLINSVLFSDEATFMLNSSVLTDRFVIISQIQICKLNGLKKLRLASCGWTPFSLTEIWSLEDPYLCYEMR